MDPRDQPQCDRVRGDHDGVQQLAGPARPAAAEHRHPPPAQCYVCTLGGHQGDPEITVSPATGAISLVALFTPSSDQGTGVFGVARKAAGQTDFERNANGDVIVRYAVPCDQAGNDRPSIVVGPKPPLVTQDDPESGYIFFDSTYTMRSARSRGDVAPVGAGWVLCGPNPGANDGYPADVTSAGGQAAGGKGAQGTVLPAGTGNGADGRVLLASRRTPYSRVAAELTWSDTGGGLQTGTAVPWHDAQLLDWYGDSNLPVKGISDVEAQPAQLPSDIAQWVHSDASISYDPRPGHQREVAVLFNGRDVDSPYPNDPPNIDFFLAWTNSADAAGPSGPQFQTSSHGWDPTARKTFRIRDDWLARPGEYYPGQRLHQFMGRVSIDSLGGVNICFMCARQVLEDPPDHTMCSVRYARWNSIADLDPVTGHAPFLWTSQEFQPYSGANGYEYIGLTISDCKAYVIYSDDLETPGLWKVKVIVIVLPCPADVTADGTIDAADAVAFGAAYIAQQSPADVNKDAVIDAQDVTDFVTVFTCGPCAIPPP